MNDDTYAVFLAMNIMLMKIEERGTRRALEFFFASCFEFDLWMFVGICHACDQLLEFMSGRLIVVLIAHQFQPTQKIFNCDHSY